VKEGTIMPHTTHKHKNGKKRTSANAETAQPVASNRQDADLSSKPNIQDRAKETGQHSDDKTYEGVARDIVYLVQKHPIPAIVIGVGLGLVFARLLRS
jgi:hypothetical protein